MSKFFVFMSTQFDFQVYNARTNPKLWLHSRPTNHRQVNNNPVIQQGPQRGLRTVICKNNIDLYNSRPAHLKVQPDHTTPPGGGTDKRAAWTPLMTIFLYIHFINNVLDINETSIAQFILVYFLSFRGH